MTDKETAGRSRSGDVEALRALVDELVSSDVPVDTIRVLAAAVRQAVRNAKNKMHGPAANTQPVSSKRRAGEHTRLLERTEQLRQDTANLSTAVTPFDQREHDDLGIKLRAHRRNLAAHKRRKHE